MVEIVGKLSRPVPVLILPSVKLAMDLLVKSRASTLSTNKYFFASDSLNGYIDSCKVLKSMAIAAQLKRPDLV